MNFAAIPNHGPLDEVEVVDFLRQSGRFAHRAPMPFSNGIRMIICDHNPGNLLRLTVSKESFDRISDAFNLHPSTISTFELHSGTFARFIQYDKSDTSTVKSISLILNAPRNWEVAIYGLSLYHDVTTRTTFVFLTGEEVCQKWDNSEITGIHSFLEDHADHWGNPLLLPIALIHDHWTRVRPLVNRLTYTMQMIEADLGVAKVGRPEDLGNEKQVAEDSIDPLTSQLPRAKVRDLTVQINTQYTKVLFCKRSPEWHTSACRFLLDLQVELAPFIEVSRGYSRPLREILEHNLNMSQSLESHMNVLQQRVDVQLNILYSIVAQTDNQLSAKLAASAGRDSTSMKILALITVLFLPATFVATLFSMSMFEWDSDEAGKAGKTVLSPKFWIYWMTTIPLTVATLIVVGFWWRYEKRRFDGQLEQALDGAQSVPRIKSRINSTLEIFPAARTFLTG